MKLCWIALLENECSVGSKLSHESAVGNRIPRSKINRKNIIDRRGSTKQSSSASSNTKLQEYT